MLEMFVACGSRLIIREQYSFASKCFQATRKASTTEDRESLTYFSRRAIPAESPTSATVLMTPTMSLAYLTGTSDSRSSTRVPAAARDRAAAVDLGGIRRAAANRTRSRISGDN